jgi:hypothetical protein
VDIVAVLAGLMDLEAQLEVVAAALRHRKALRLDDEVAVGNPVVKKAVADMVALSKDISGYFTIIETQHTLWWIWSVISLRILLGWSSLRRISSAISLIVTAVLVGRLSLCH